MRRRRGVALLVVALAAAVLCGCVALVVDLGMVRLLRAQLQAGTDAAALAGARRLDGSAAGIAAGRATAVEVAGENTAFDAPLAVDPNPTNAADGDVVVGHWDGTAFEASLDPATADAVLVRTHHDDLATWFAVVLGRDRMAAGAISIATQGRRVGAGRVPYYLPFSLPLCTIEAHSTEQILDTTFVLNPAGADTVGWGAVEANPTASWARDHIDAMLECMHAWSDTGTIPTACTEVSAGDSVDLGTGEQASALTYLSGAMSRGVAWDPERWGALPDQHPTSSVPAADYGQVLEGPIPVFDGGGEYCTSAAPWNETFPVRGFVWGVIYDVAANGPAAKRNLWVRLDVAHVYDVGEWSGGGSWGVTWLGPPVLVW